jgi:hypothetical protein
MTKSIVGLWLVALILTLAGNAWSAEKYQYVLDATRKIIDLNSQSVSPGPDEIAKASAEACNALKQLLLDKAFREDLDKMTQADAKTRERRTEIKRDLTLFVAAFLRPEEAALRKSGLTEEATKRILWSASLLQRALDDKHDPNRILTALDKFRDELCQGAKMIQESKNESTRRTTLQKWSFRIGGVAMIVVDLASAAPTGAVAVGSVAIGTAIMSWGPPQ